MPWYSDLVTRVVGRQTAPPVVPPRAGAPPSAAEARQDATDAFEAPGRTSGAPQGARPAPAPEPPQTLRKRRLEARADVTALTLPIDREVASARALYGWQRPTAYEDLYARYTALLQAHPHSDVLLAKRILLSKRLGEEGAEEADLKALAVRVPSLLRRATLWLGLFVDRPLPAESSHALFGTSLATLRELSAFDALLPAEQEALVLQTSRHAGDLLARAIAAGGVADASTALEMAWVCWDRVQASGPSWLGLGLAHEADQVCAELLRAGVEVAETQRAALVRLGIAGGRRSLLAELLARPELLTPHELLDDGDGPYTLAQGAAAARWEVVAKLQLVASAGALAVARPTGSPLPSVLDSALAYGDAGVRMLLRMPFVWDAPEQDGSPAPVAQLVAADNGAALHLVLQCGLALSFRNADGATLAELAEACGAEACRRVLDMHAARARSQPHLLRDLSLPALTAHHLETQSWTTGQLAAFDGLYALAMDGKPEEGEAVERRDALAKALHSVWHTAGGRDAAWRRALGEALGRLESVAQCVSVLRAIGSGLAWYDTDSLRMLPGHLPPLHAHNDLLLLAAHRTRHFGEGTFAAACAALAALYPKGLSRTSVDDYTAAVHVAARQRKLYDAVVAELERCCGSRTIRPKERMRRGLALLRGIDEAPWYYAGFASGNVWGASGGATFAPAYAWGGVGAFVGGFSREDWLGDGAQVSPTASLRGASPVPLPQALQRALDAWAQEPCVGGAEAAVVSMPALQSAHEALADEDVEDRLAEPPVADATLALLGRVLGTQLTRDILLGANATGAPETADANAKGGATGPTAALALKKRLAAWHTDRGHADAARAEATTRLLILAKEHLTVAPAVEVLRLAAARTAPERAP